MEKECYYSLIVGYIVENSIIMTSRGMAGSSGLMANTMKAVGAKTRCMGKAF